MILTNSGAIVSTVTGTFSVIGSAQIDVITNTGQINRSVSQGGGDIFNGIGGTVGGTILGGDGNDIYGISDPLAVIFEAAGEGTADQINATVSFELAAGSEVENLTLLGPASYGFDNEFANTVTGNGLSNLLLGRNGNDTLNGNADDDTLRGGIGNVLVNGGDGDDVSRGGTGADSLFGGEGDGGLWQRGGQLRLVAGANSVVQGDVNGDGVADFEVQLNAIATVSVNDILL